MRTRNCIRIGWILFLCCISLRIEACRFTVREIGFSSLSPTKYSLVVIDDQVSYEDPLYQQLAAQVKISNIQLLLLDPEKDARHPYVVRAKQSGLHFPTACLLDVQNRLLPLCEDESYSFPRLVDWVPTHVLTSPLRNLLLVQTARTFAYLLRIPGKISEENRQMDSILQDDCAHVLDIMKLMPKSVERPPQVLSFPVEKVEDERVLLWSLGLDELPDHPMVFVFYGRGRFMGDGLDFKEMKERQIFRYLAMVGADCECNLDRSWMLGTQIPLKWEKSVQQDLADELTFDVDNPLILAEMSRILSKEEPGGNATITYTPETIDLDEVFQEKPNTRQVDISDEFKQTRTLSTLWITLSSFFFLALCVSVIILWRKKRED